MVLASEIVDRSRAVKTEAKKSRTRANILNMINSRTGGPGLADLKNKLKTESF